MNKTLPIIIAIAILALAANYTIAQTFTYPIKGKQGFDLTEKTRDGLHINGNGEAIMDTMTVFVGQNTVIENALFDQYYCATDAPQPIAVKVLGDYVSFQWLTDGDGEFGDAHAMVTTYSAGLKDLANGVTLTAFVVTPGCGTVTYDYPFEINPFPEMTLETESINLCEGENAVMNFMLEGYTSDGAQTSPDFVVIINGEIYELTQNATSIDLGALETGENVFNINSIQNRTCNVDFEDGEFTYTVTVSPSPTVTISEVPESICEGENVDIKFDFTGTPPFNVYLSEADDFTSEENTYTLTLAPTVSSTIVLTMVEDANGCENYIVSPINLNVTPRAKMPEISGDTEVDVRLAPTTTYTIDNDVIAGLSIEPEEAGTLVPANDGKSVVVTWSDTYKGEAVLTAIPDSDCNSGNGTMSVTVRNSTNITEYGLNASLYPNPTKSNITIEAKDLQRLTVVNELGQVVYDAEVNSDSKTLNMSQFGAGIYLIRIYSENGIGLKRVTVIR